MAHARTPMDGGDEDEEGQYATFPEASVGLERLIASRADRLFFLFLTPDWVWRWLHLMTSTTYYIASLPSLNVNRGRVLDID